MKKKMVVQYLVDCLGFSEDEAALEVHDYGIKNLTEFQKSELVEYSKV